MQVASIRLLRQLSAARPVLGLCTRRAERHLHWTQKEDPFTIVTDGMVDLAHKIKGNSPISDSMFNSLLLHGRGHARECTFYTLRDRPESHAVMWRYLQPSNTLLALHCREEEVQLLKESLMQSDLIDWQGRLCVFHVPEYLVDTVRDVVREKGGQELTSNKVYTFSGHYVGNPFTYLADNSIRCPAGYRVARLGRAGVRIMRNTTEHDICRTLDDMVHITKHAPSVGLYEDPSVEKETDIDIKKLPFAGDEEVPIAWVTTSFYGAMGTYMTQQRNRNRGLGDLLCRVIGVMQIAQGYLPHGHVDLDNLPSISSVKAINQVRMSHSVYFMFRK
ncbi:uncharacterized protein LOC122258872 [Penaeus japonicus]|uniref:uncharacterized protein LOC122258872 n=1 Tax=Penaeus japonicus TaxID=27405 RepID=UPI001C70EDA3|nr:uncharacterized protein LOC122258872 [Penaeus japonicus]XP_042881077.1 uncharacterized protein LOC122258872 [Penaeus japonicus]